MPFVLLGAAVSLGVVAVTASRFGWRRAKSAEPEGTTSAPEATAAPEPPLALERRFKPALRWDAPPGEYAAARASGDPPAS